MRRKNIESAQRDYGLAQFVALVRVEAANSPQSNRAERMSIIVDMCNAASSPGTA
jgi:hypothetical protein